ncbi:MAG: hypothetical protein FJX42_01235 [Alphaproteobacteria bacterium]|nr:hypothetical protein [Alphaproteobacteria bacterium]
MTGDSQREAVAFLSRPESYGPDVTEVRRIETHISHVFLAGSRAFKLKKAVRYPYLDFSTPEKRRAACGAEVAVNRRTAPGLYRGVAALTRAPEGGLVIGGAIGGAGETVDWLVEMARFDEDTLFDRLARQGRLDRRLIEDLAGTVAGFHRAAEAHPETDMVENLRQTIAGDAASMTGPAGGVFSGEETARLAEASSKALEALAPLLRRRRDQGLVRRCHGDLHLRNICLIENRPVLFDAIEFNDAFAVIDVLYDAAFLVMDLIHIGQAALASMFLNRYLDEGGTALGGDEGLGLIPLFLSLRAAIRAHVAGTAAAALAGDAAAAQRAEARRYLDEAVRYLSPDGAGPRLVAVGGLSGSGKSRLAREIAPLLGPAPGARVVRTDVVRKQIAGAGLTERLGEGGYGAEMTERTYVEFFRRVEAALAAGTCVVADAVFARAEQRDAVAAVAARRGIPFVGLWLEADPAIMEARVAGRTGNVSDATVAVLRRQRDYDLGVMNWRRIDSGGSRQETLDKVKAALGSGPKPL